MSKHLLIGLLALISANCQAAEGGLPPAVRVEEMRVELGDRNIRLSLAVFPEKEFSIRVIDNLAPNDTGKFARLADAMEAFGCVAGCNGGFFERQPFSPVGLMVSESKRTGTFDPNSWMKGLLVVRQDRAFLESSDSFKDTPDISEALQSGPWLVRAGRAQSDPSRAQSARRTFICHDWSGNWAIGASDRCTLDELATLLRKPAVVAIFDVQNALNLDGGPSNGLWVKEPPHNFYLPEKWVVRNYLGISPRPPK